MSLELAKAWVRVRADGSMLGPDLRGIQGQFREIISGISAGVASVTGSFAALSGGFLRRGLAGAGIFEQTMVEMETMLGSAKEAKNTLAELTDFAVKTPFEMPGILQVATGLIQFGERGNELMETMNILADASGGTAHKFQILGLVLNQIRGVGRLLTQDFRQLSTRGIISLQDIAKFYKVDTAEAQKRISDGKVSFEDFKKILKGLTEEGGRFYKMSEKQSRTLIGLQSTLSDAWNITLRKLATGIVPIVKQGLDIVIQWANALEMWVTKTGPAAARALAFASATASLVAALTAGRIAARLMGTTLLRLFIGSGIGIAIIALAAGVGYLVGQFAKAKDVQEAWSDALALFKLAWMDLKVAFVQAWNAMAEILEEFGVDLKKLRNDTKTVLIDVIRAVSEFVADFAEWMRVLTKNWRQVWERLPDIAIAGIKLLGASILKLLSDMWKNASPLMRTFMLTMAAVIAVWAAYRIAVSLAAMAQAIFFAMSGPKGWAIVIVGLMAALAAVVAFGEGMRAAGKIHNKAVNDMKRALGGLVAEKEKLEAGRQARFIGRFVQDEVDNWMKQWGKAKDGFDFWAGEWGKKAGDAAAKQMGIEGGVAGFAELGNRIQQKLLEAMAGDKQAAHNAKMVNIGQQQLGVQQNLLQAVVGAPKGVLK